MSQRILLITPKFYGFEFEIKKELENLGFETVWIENKILKFDYHGPDSKLRFLRKIYFFFFFPQIRYIRKELKQIKDLHFDILFAINGQILCPYLLKKLRKKKPSLFSILYLWDAFSKYSFAKELRLFNKVYTFDKEDAIKYGIEYKPNFYIAFNYLNRQEQQFDIFFAGKFSPYRFNIINRVINYSENFPLNYYVKIFPSFKIFPHHHLVYSVLKKLKFNVHWIKNYLMNFEILEGITNRDFIINESLNHNEIQSSLICSNVILDLPYLGQSGYTHLLIEALANGKKVITSNDKILKEDFFNPDQIHFTIDFNLDEEINWILKKQVFKIDNYFLNLELSQWLKSIIDARVA